jgi:hypothetical protein
MMTTMLKETQKNHSSILNLKKNIVNCQNTAAKYERFVWVTASWFATNVLLRPHRSSASKASKLISRCDVIKQKVIPSISSYYTMRHNSQQHCRSKLPPQLQNFCWKRLKSHHNQDSSSNNTFYGIIIYCNTSILLTVSNDPICGNNKI